MRLLLHVLTDRFFTMLLIVGLFCLGNLALTGELSLLRAAEFVGAVLLSSIAGVSLTCLRMKRRGHYRQNPVMRVAWVDDDGNLKWKDWDGSILDEADGNRDGTLGHGEPGQPR